MLQIVLIMTKADKKIIEDNPGKSAYELFNLGISQKAYDELVEKEAADNAQKGAPRPVKVEKIEMASKPQPQRPQIRPAEAVTTNAQLHNKKTGRTVSMARKQAEYLARTSPQEFQLLN